MLDPLTVNGKMRSLRVSYPWRPRRCPQCLSFGHANGECKRDQGPKVVNKIYQKKTSAVAANSLVPVSNAFALLQEGNNDVSLVEASIIHAPPSGTPHAPPSCASDSPHAPPSCAAAKSPTHTTSHAPKSPAHASTLCEGSCKVQPTQDSSSLSSIEREEERVHSLLAANTCKRDTKDASIASISGDQRIQVDSQMVEKEGYAHGSNKGIPVGMDSSNADDPGEEAGGGPAEEGAVEALSFNSSSSSWRWSSRCRSSRDHSAASSAATTGRPSPSSPSPTSSSTSPLPRPCAASMSSSTSAAATSSPSPSPLTASSSSRCAAPPRWPQTVRRTSCWRRTVAGGALPGAPRELPEQVQAQLGAPLRLPHLHFRLHRLFLRRHHMLLAPWLASFRRHESHHNTSSNYCFCCC
ncbi:hypothetical protein Taro_037080 [Colocasia esculenta]|uniref:Uncharacterized protein n=1 Tax=Colocasia esculenta TaxID=4460 RepID=A0A843VZF3_COLES|nr:hypothetical protein [Colocasia esculenta]